MSMLPDNRHISNEPYYGRPAYHSAHEVIASEGDIDALLDDLSLVLRYMKKYPAAFSRVDGESLRDGFIRVRESILHLEPSVFLIGFAEEEECLMCYFEKEDVKGYFNFFPEEQGIDCQVNLFGREKCYIDGTIEECILQMGARFEEPAMCDDIRRIPEETYTAIAV